MMLAKAIVALALFGALGALLGYVQFSGLRRNVESYVQLGVRPRSVGPHALRLALVAGGFIALVRFGAGPLLAAFGGLLLMRLILLLRYRSQS